MADPEYVIHAVWDESAGVFYAESNVPGLHVEAETIQQFIDVLQDVVPELLAANHALPAPKVRLDAELALA